MAADVISQAGIAVNIYDAMPSVGRKFLLAGVGGMNITHAEPAAQFLTRYAAAETALTPFIRQFDAQALRAWVHDLGIETFVGSSQRVFPRDMKAAPLLRAWLHRLRAQGVNFYPRHRWLGWTPAGALRFAATHRATHMAEEKIVTAQATVLTLGGGSWARLGSDGAWVPLLRAQGVEVAELQPSNCGFEVNWSEFFASRFAGQPLTTVAFASTDIHGSRHHLRGEATLTRYGIEGSAIYALSAVLRESIKHTGSAQLELDLLPDHSYAQVLAALNKPRHKDSFSNFLRKQLKLTPPKIALINECVTAAGTRATQELAAIIKALPLVLTAARPLDEAISSAGGICFNTLDEQLMLRNLPGVFCAGEMLNWEAPTGGYLLTACFATGKAAGMGVRNWLSRSRHAP